MRVMCQQEVVDPSDPSTTPALSLAAVKVLKTKYVVPLVPTIAFH